MKRREGQRFARYVQEVATKDSLKSVNLTGYGKPYRMNCTTPHCKGTVTKHKKLKVCVRCYGKLYYDKNYKSLKRLAKERDEGVRNR